LRYYNEDDNPKDEDDGLNEIDEDYDDNEDLIRPKGRQDIGVPAGRN